MLTTCSISQDIATGQHRKYSIQSPIISATLNAADSSLKGSQYNGQVNRTVFRVCGASGSSRFFYGTFDSGCR
jgi:hypothetical protein